MRLTRNIFLLATLFAWSFAPAQSSRTELRTLTVPGVGSWDFNVYLPPGYDQTSERYPVLYLFRGAVDEWLDRTEDASRSGRNIQMITDTLITQKKMGGVIIVMQGFTAMTGPATEADYSFVLNTLIPHIDARYRTLPTRWHRALDGFSLGGLHMVNLIWRKPERFASAGFYDGTTSQFNSSQMSTAGEQYFARIRPMQFLLHSAAVAPSNLNNNRQFLALLNSFGIRNTFDDLVFSSTSQHNWWYADEHMMRALPLHWTKCQSPSQNVPLQWISSAATRVSGTVRLSWSVGPAADSLKTLVDLSNDAGATWQTLLYSARKDTVFDWNTLGVKDGTRYLLRTQIFGDTSYGVIQSAQRFAVDNPGNGAPDVAITTPGKLEIISGTYTVKWFAEDPEGAPVQISLSASGDNGRSWQQVAGTLANTGFYILDTRLLANSITTLLKIIASDGTQTAEALTGPFEVRNSRFRVGNIKHVTGRGNGLVTVNIADVRLLTGHSYRISFDDSSSSRKSYSVFDLTARTYPLRNVAFDGDGSEGPLFDGVRISVVDYPIPLLDKDSTRWTKGSSTLLAQVTVPVVFLGADTVRGIPSPADYEFRIADLIVDTSSSYLGATVTPLSFTTWNVTENRRVKVLVNELDGNGRISRFDEIYILELDSKGQPILTWVVFFTGNDNAALPLAGDVFTVRTLKPLRSTDIFEFSTPATGVADGTTLLPESVELLQNYPNPFNGQTVIRFRLPAAGLVKLEVYDILGSNIRVLVDERKNEGTHVVNWDAAGHASGCYFYRLSVDGSVVAKKALLLR